MNNFNYNNYIGEHMGIDNYLKVKHKEDGRLYDLVSIDMLENESIGLYDNFMRDTDWYSKDDFLMIIKSPADLTNEELLWVFGNIKGSFISRNKSTISLGIGGGGDAYLQINLKNGQLNTTDQFYNIQQILNRLYSLHVSLDYEELIKNDKAVRKQ